uniref:Hypermethylated in cancer 2 protein n=1 Tax=Oncorhynchus tshawytscha TaxID=74940 RepID=A0A8C8I9B3_ONCTS
MEQQNHSKQLLLQLNQQRAKGYLCDVIIVVENALFRAHKNVLAASSVYFKSLVPHDNLINLDTEMVSPSIFRQVLDFIYTGCLSSSDSVSDHSISSLLIAASYLQLTELAALCRRKLKHNGQTPSSSNKMTPSSSTSPTPNGHTPGRSNGLGLDLSKRSPSESTATEEVSPSSLLQKVDGEENGLDQSEGSGHSGRGGGGRKGRRNGNTNYIYRQPQPGFEPGVGDNLYVCIPCGKGFPSSEQLNAHEEEEYDSASKGMKPDPEEPGHLCTVCSKSCKDATSLRQHEKSHWLNRPFPCNICGKLFTQRGTMTRHMRSHLGLKPFACEECGMRFTRQYRLAEHMRVHSGEKPYECQLCGGKFTQQRNLLSHMRMHTSPS